MCLVLLISGYFDVFKVEQGQGTASATASAMFYQ